jgi:hypothetical protein
MNRKEIWKKSEKFLYFFFVFLLPIWSLFYAQLFVDIEQ